MEYVCHKRYKKIGASGREYNFSYGKKLQSIGKFIAYDNAAVCCITSDDAFRHFARNDDGNGLKRGKLTYDIAYAPKKPNKDNGFRFTDEQVKMLKKEYKRFLVKTDVILFNEKFFNADIKDLEKIKKRLEET